MITTAIYSASTFLGMPAKRITIHTLSYRRLGDAKKVGIYV